MSIETERAEKAMSNALTTLRGNKDAEDAVRILKKGIVDIENVKIMRDVAKEEIKKVFGDS